MSSVDGAGSGGASTGASSAGGSSSDSSTDSSSNAATGAAASNNNTSATSESSQTNSNSDSGSDNSSNSPSNKSGSDNGSSNSTSDSTSLDSINNSSVNNGNSDNDDGDNNATSISNSPQLDSFQTKPDQFAASPTTADRLAYSPTTADLLSDVGSLDAAQRSALNKSFESFAPANDFASVDEVGKNIRSRIDYDSFTQSDSLNASNNPGTLSSEDTTQQDDQGGLFSGISNWASRAENAIADTAGDVGDWASDVNEEYKVTTRAMGALTVAGGVGEAILSSVGIVAPEPLTSIAGGLLVVQGADTAAAGGTQAAGSNGGKSSDDEASGDVDTAKSLTDNAANSAGAAKENLERSLDRRTTSTGLRGAFAFTADVFGKAVGAVSTALGFAKGYNRERDGGGSKADAVREGFREVALGVDDGIISGGGLTAGAVVVGGAMTLTPAGPVGTAVGATAGGLGGAKLADKLYNDSALDGGFDSGVNYVFDTIEDWQHRK